MRKTSHATFQLTAKPSYWRQFTALARKNNMTMLRDYAPTISAVLSPVYFLVILIFLNLAVARPDTGK